MKITVCAGLVSRQHYACSLHALWTGQNQGNHKQSSEAEMKFAFKLQICLFHDTHIIHFSSSADQVFGLFCLLHLSNMNKEEVQKRQGFVLALKAHIFYQNQLHCE